MTHVYNTSFTGKLLTKETLGTIMFCKCLSSPKKDNICTILKTTYQCKVIVYVSLCLRNRKKTTSIVKSYAIYSFMGQDVYLLRHPKTKSIRVRI